MTDRDRKRDRKEKIKRKKGRAKKRRERKSDEEIHRRTKNYLLETKSCVLFLFLFTVKTSLMYLLQN